MPDSSATQVDDLDAEQSAVAYTLSGDPETLARLQLDAATTAHRKALEGYRANPTPETRAEVLHPAGLVAKAALAFADARIDAELTELARRSSIVAALMHRPRHGPTLSVAPIRQARPNVVHSRHTRSRRRRSTVRARARRGSARAPGRPGDDDPSPLADSQPAPIGGAR